MTRERDIFIDIVFFLIVVLLLGIIVLQNQSLVELSATNAHLQHQVSEEKLKMYEEVRTLATITQRADHEVLLLRGVRMRAEENANRIQEMEMRARGAKTEGKR